VEMHLEGWQLVMTGVGAQFHALVVLLAGLFLNFIIKLLEFSMLFCYPNLFSSKIW